MKTRPSCGSSAIDLAAATMVCNLSICHMRDSRRVSDSSWLRIAVQRVGLSVTPEYIDSQWHSLTSEAKIRQYGKNQPTIPTLRCAARASENTLGTAPKSRGGVCIEKLTRNLRVPCGSTW